MSRPTDKHFKKALQDLMEAHGYRLIVDDGMFAFHDMYGDNWVIRFVEDRPFCGKYSQWPEM